MRRRSTHYLVHVPTATGDLDQRVDMKNYNVVILRASFSLRSTYEFYSQIEDAEIFH